MLIDSSFFAMMLVYRIDGTRLTLPLPTAQILSRLYMCKLEEWLQSPRHLPARCSLCHELYPQSARALLPCAHAPVRIDVHGQLRARHQPDPAWSLQQVCAWVGGSMGVYVCAFAFSVPVPC